MSRDRAPVQGGNLGWGWLPDAAILDATRQGVDVLPSRVPDGSVSWADHLLAYAAYAAKYGTEQSAERIADRGGFGVEEIGKILNVPHALDSWRPR
jgi:hypothetical protein